MLIPRKKRLVNSDRSQCLSKTRAGNYGFIQRGCYWLRFSSASHRVWTHPLSDAPGLVAEWYTPDDMADCLPLGLMAPVAQVVNVTIQGRPFL